MIVRVKGKRPARSAMLVSADHTLAADLGRALQTAGFRVETTRTVSNALYRFRKARPDLLLLDSRFVKEGELGDMIRSSAGEHAISDHAEPIVVDKWTIDPGSRTVQYLRRQAQLTSTECALLIELVRSRERTVTRDELLDSLGDHGRVFDRTIDRHICNLRRKLDAVSSRSRLIVTVHGVGYRLNLRG